jgi:hypothetical protein
MKITFFTTSTLSDIQDLQSKCIRKFFPESKQVIIDGRGGWFSIWYKWLDIAKDIESDWFIHLDEDCFITKSEDILSFIEMMEKDGIDIAGPPDGCNEYRSGNHIALNSFFMILNKKCINTWYNRKDTPQFKEEWIEEYPFIKKNSSHFDFNMEFGSSGKPVHIIWKPNTEPYYDFMWVLKDNGIKFRYIEPIFGEEFQTTNLINNSVMHMWHQRERWSTNIVSSIHTMSNKDRYDGVIKKINNILNE